MTESDIKDKVKNFRRDTGTVSALGCVGNAIATLGYCILVAGQELAQAIKSSKEVRNERYEAEQISLTIAERDADTEFIQQADYDYDEPGI